MENNEEAVSRWVDERLGALDPDSSFQPNLDGGLKRLHNRPRSNFVRARRLLWASAATAAAATAMVTLPAPRSLAERCWQCVASLAPSIRYTVLPLTAEGKRPQAPGFSLTDAAGSPVTLADFRGKVVLLDFWATWCPPCKIEIPWFIEMQRDYKDRGLVVLGVSLDEDGWKTVRPFVARERINYRVAIGDDRLASLYGGVEALPTTFVIDRRGRIAAVHSGLASKQQFLYEVERLLAEQQ